MTKAPSLQAIEREEARRSLIDFTEYTFPGYRRNWHHELIASWLDDVIAGDRDRVIITTPPRRGKSELVSRRFPAYAMGRGPDTKIISTSYAASLAEAMNRDVQRIIGGERYVELFPDTQIDSDKACYRIDADYKCTDKQFEIADHDGHYFCAGVDGDVTGRGADYLIIDDPVKNRKQANSATFRDTLWNFYTDDLLTRGNYPFAVIVMATRWHEDDLIGRLLDKEAERWDVLHLPEIQKPDSEIVPSGCDYSRDYDPRGEGEPLWPGWFLADHETTDPERDVPKDLSGDDVEFVGRDELEQRARDSFGSWEARTRLSLFQGRPTSDEGDMFERAWFQRYSAPPDRVPCDEKIISVDCAFRDSDTSDYVVLQVWGKNGARKYLLDQTRGKMGITGTRDALRDLSAKWPDAHVKLIETKANGDALIDLLKGKVPGLIGFNPEASKEARAKVAAWEFEARDVFLPEAQHAPWIGDYIEELASFPNAPNDDQVDATSQVMIRWKSANQDPKNSMARILGR